MGSHIDPAADCQTIDGAECVRICPLPDRTRSYAVPAGCSRPLEVVATANAVDNGRSS